MSNQVFMAVDPYPGLNARLRRALAQVDFDAPYISKCLEACRKLKLKTVTPIYEPEIWAHIGIPSLKTVMYFRNVHDTERVNKDRAIWAKKGWTLLFSLTDEIDKMTVDEVTARLGLALKGMRGNKA